MPGDSTFSGNKEPEPAKKTEELSSVQQQVMDIKLNYANESERGLHLLEDTREIHEDLAALAVQKMIKRDFKSFEHGLSLVYRHLSSPTMKGSPKFEVMMEALKEMAKKENLEFDISSGTTKKIS